jgi:hypothetical protein
MGWTTEYEGSEILEDGRTFSVTYIAYEEHSTRDDPGDYEESDETYYIDGEPCEFEDLPDEVTLEFIERVKSTAVERGSNRGRRLNRFD